MVDVWIIERHWVVKSLGVCIYHTIPLTVGEGGGLKIEGKIVYLCIIFEQVELNCIGLEVEVSR